VLIRLLSFLASSFIRFLRLTWCVRLEGIHLLPAGRPLVFCFWHGVQAGLFAYARPGRVAVMSSLSRDGELQARILQRLGFAVFRGSSSRSGASGLKGLIGALRSGMDAAFAVDGPRGPLHEVKPGALLAARAAGGLIVPITARSSRAFIFDRAWDRYALPRPFAAVTIAAGTPLDPMHTSTADLARALLALDEGAAG